MAKFIKLYNDHTDRILIDEVVDTLRNGGLVIYPTDTVYGLGASIKSSRAIERLAQLKGTKVDKANFTFLFPDLSNLSEYTKQIDTPTFKILKKAFPGPYTMILPANNNLPKFFKKRKTIGMRVPENNILQQIINELGNPLVNISIKDDDEVIEYTTDPELIYEKWGKLVDVIINAGYGNNNPSTIIDLTGSKPEIVREGKGDIEILNL
jgi:tRNA threonylcarbamoyl adenosine modification protein (Sua5/YciO/YrdC/YwlC family)